MPSLYLFIPVAQMLRAGTGMQATGLWGENLGQRLGPIHARMYIIGPRAKKTPINPNQPVPRNFKSASSI